MRKTLEILLVVSLVLTTGSGLLARHFRHNTEKRARVEAEHVRLTVEAQKKAETVSGIMWKAIRSARTVEEWKRLLEKDTQHLSGREREEATALVKAKLAEGYFWRAEHLFSSARVLMSEDQNHPTAKRYILSAEEIYKKIDSLLGALAETPGDREWNTKINYFRGKYFYRQLPLVKEPEREQAKIQDLIVRSAGHLGKVLEFSPMDHDTQIALELLQKKAQNMTSGGLDRTKIQLELLPMPSKEIKPDFAIGGGREGRH